MRKTTKISGFVSVPVIIMSAVIAVGLIGGIIYGLQHNKGKFSSGNSGNLLAQIVDIASSTPAIAEGATTTAASQQESSLSQNAVTVASLQNQLNALLVELKNLQDKADQQSAEQESFSYTWDHDLYYGLRNDEDVRALQNALLLESVYKGPVTGDFLSLTRQAIIDFQKKHNFTSVPETGYVGPYTIKVLNDLYSKPPELMEGQG